MRDIKAVYMHPDIHSHPIHNSQDMEVSNLSVYQQMNRPIQNKEFKKMSYKDILYNVGNIAYTL